MVECITFAELFGVAVPEIQIRTLSPEDEFLILACDGLWDVWHNSQRVIEVARQNLQQNNNDPQACADFLVRQLIVSSKISQGPMSVVGIPYNGACSCLK